MNHRISTALLALVTLVLVGAWVAPQPAPAGNVINTLPTVINSAGTYCLTGDLWANPGDGGITVNAPFVVIDLGGYRLVGAADGSHGIVTTKRDVQVRNGSIENWEYGVLLGTEAKVSNVRFSHCARSGMQASFRATVESCRFFDNPEANLAVSTNSVIRDCRIDASPNYSAIETGTNSLVERCYIQGGKNGIYTFERSRVRDCSVRDFEELGIRTGPGATVSECSVGKSQGSGFTGIDCGTESTVRDCKVTGDVNVGIEVGDFSTVQDSVARGVIQVGIVASRGSKVLDCTALENNQNGQPLGAGILAYSDVRIANTLVADNLGRGILFLDEGGEVLNCTAINNTASGIEVTEGVVVLDCLAKNNGMFGIRMTGDRGRIQRNTVDANEKGLVVHGRLNLVTDNRASQNRSGGYDVPWGNPTGPILQTNWVIQGSTPQANFDTR